MTNIQIRKQVFNKTDFGKVINTDFTQFVNIFSEETPPEFTIEDFFILYEKIFYQIPKEGLTNSHRYILEKEAEFLGVIISEDDVQALLDEITALRQQVLDSQQSIKELISTQ